MTGNKILLWGAIPELPKGETYDISYKRSGHNFGNTLIGNGVVSVLRGYEYLRISQLASPQEANEKCSHIVIPAANFLWKGFDFGEMADFIEATTLPVTIVGLGAQTHDRSMISEIHPNTLRLVKIIAERSPSLGVRGYYTAEVLAANGIMNVEVLGCPSLYTKGSPPKYINNNSTASVADLAVNFSRRVSGHSFAPEALRKIENALLKIAVENQLPFIAQDELEELALAAGVGTDVGRKSITSYFNETTDSVVTDYFTKKTNYFCTINDWSDFMVTRSGCIGSRLHGNIMALINGVPGLTIAHDSRTIEMCALTGAPYLHVKQYIEASVKPQDLINKFREADYSIFISNMRILFDRYKEFLTRHGLRNCL